MFGGSAPFGKSVAAADGAALGAAAATNRRGFNEVVPSEGDGGMISTTAAIGVPAEGRRLEYSSAVGRNA
jgi:hypothetical protein